MSNLFGYAFCLLPISLTLFFDNWVIDYISPVITLVIAFLYVLLALVNYKKDRFKQDVAKFACALIIGLIHLVLVSNESESLKIQLDNVISGIETSICREEGSSGWQHTIVNTNFLSARVNYINSDSQVEIRSTPMLFNSIDDITFVCKTPSL